MKRIFCILNNIKSSIEKSSDSLLKVMDNDVISIGDLSLIENENVFVADGGINFLKEEFLKKNKIFWIGDYDSVDDGFLLDEFCFYKEELNRDKDFSDFARVLDYIEKNIDEDEIFIEVYNGLGGDRSHEYSNILEIRNFLKKISSFSKTATIFIEPSVIITNRKITLMLEKNRMFSVISLEDKDKDNNKNLISIDGARYQGQIKLTRASLGTRNLATSNMVEIDSKENILMIIID